MGIPVVIVSSGGLPVTEATNGYGVPMTEATNGFGIPVTFVAAGGAGGGSLAVTGIVSGPSIQLSASSVAENAAVSTVIGTLSVINGTGTYTFTLTNSAGGKFVLGGVNNSSLRTAALLDYETASSHVIAVSATNGVTPIAAKNFTISVTDVAGPTITSSATTSVLENAVLAHALTAGESSTWSLVGGVDQARFELSGSTLRWLANGTKDYEMPDDADANNTYVVQVRATSVATGETTNQTVTVTVLDDTVDTLVPSAPTLVWVSGTSDNMPNFTVDLPSGFGDYRDAATGDIIYLEITDNVAFSTSSTDTLDAGEVSGDIVAMEQVTPLVDGTYYARARLKRGANYGAYSNVENKTISTFDSATTAWETAVIAAGGSVSGTQKTRVNTLIAAYKSASVWTLLDRVWLLAAENATQAKVDLKAGVQWTAVGSPGFTANTGYNAPATGATDAINTNFTPSTNGVAYTQNSNHFSVYVKTGNGPGAGAAYIGVNDGGQFSYLEQNASAADLAYDANGAAFPGVSGLPGNNGQLFVTRTSSTNVALYRNGVTTPINSNGADTSGAIATVPFYLFRVNPFGHGSNANVVLSAATFGGGLNSTQMAAAAAAMNTYMTAIGNNTY